MIYLYWFPVQQQSDIPEDDEGDSDDDDPVFGITSVINLTLRKVSAGYVSSWDTETESYQFLCNTQMILMIKHG